MVWDTFWKLLKIETAAFNRAPQKSPGPAPEKSLTANIILSSEPPRPQAIRSDSPGLCYDPPILPNSLRLGTVAPLSDSAIDPIGGAASIGARLLSTA